MGHFRNYKSEPKIEWSRMCRVCKDRELDMDREAEEREEAKRAQTCIDDRLHNWQVIPGTTQLFCTKCAKRRD